MKQPVPNLHVTPALHRALAGCLALPALFMAAHAAGFTGYFDVTPPDAGLYYLSQSFGNWNGYIDRGFGNVDVASIDTSGAPNSVTLTAQPQILELPRSQNRGGALQGDEYSISQLTIAAPSKGTFSFSYSLSLSGTATASYLENGTWTSLDPNSSTLSLILDAGEIFGFQVVNTGWANAIGDLGPAGRGAALATDVTDSLVIRDPSFEPVPETSTVAAGLALAGLAGWSCFRARRRA